MSIWEFIWRVLDNVIWIIGSLHDPAAIITAIANLIQLFAENIYLF